jgi:hypothetical protein
VKTKEVILPCHNILFIDDSGNHRFFDLQFQVEDDQVFHHTRQFWQQLSTLSQTPDPKATTTDPQYKNPALPPPSIHNTSIIISASPTIPTIHPISIHPESSNLVAKDMPYDRSDLPTDPPIAPVTKPVSDTDIVKTDT